MYLAACRQIQASFAGFRTQTFNCSLCLLACDTFTFTTNNPVNPRSVNHDVDRETQIAVTQPFGHDAVFVDSTFNREGTQAGTRHS